MTRPNEDYHKSGMVGVGQSMWHVIFGRVVSGIGGSAVSVGTAVIIIGSVGCSPVVAEQMAISGPDDR